MHKTIHTKVINHGTFEENMLHVEKVIKENGFGILYTIDF
jgi:uncharacterized protein (DUF302 family)